MKSKINPKVVTLILTMMMLLPVLLFAQKPKQFIKEGDNYFAKQEYELAKEEYTKALNVDAECIEAYEARAKVFIRQSEFALAALDYGKAFKLDPGNTKFGYEASFNFFINEDYDNTLLYINDVLIADKKNINAYLLKLKVLDVLDNYNEMVITATSGLEYDKKNPDLLYFKGVALVMIGENKAAVCIFDQLREEEAELKDIDVWYAQACYNLGEYQEALKWCNKAVYEHPENPQVSYIMAKACVATNQWTSAVNAYSQYLMLVPDDIVARYSRAEINQQLNNYGAAIVDYNVIVTIDSSDYRALYLKAKCYDNVLDKDQAITTYKKVILACSDNEEHDSLAVAASEALFELKRETAFPTISVLQPRLINDVLITSTPEVYIRFHVKDHSNLTSIKVNDEEIALSSDSENTHDFNLKLNLEQVTSINVEAVDVYGNVAAAKFPVIFDMQFASTVPGGNEMASRVVRFRENLSGTDSTLNYYALIIGVNDYTDESINDLVQPMQDAMALQEVLVENYIFEEEDVKILQNPTKKDIMQSLEFYMNSCSDNDNLLIFYAGHGYWDERFEEGYWLLADSDKENRGTWMPNATIRNYMKAIPSRHNLLITDACFGGGIFKTRDAFANSSTAISQLYKLPSRKAMTSGALSEVPDKSVFAEYLVRRLTENADEFLSSEQLFASFKIAVINNSANGQVPQFGEVKGTGDEGGDFIFVKRVDEVEEEPNK